MPNVKPHRSPKAQKNAAALTFALIGNNLPEGCNAHIFPDGAFRSDDNRPARVTEGSLQHWQMNHAVAARLITALEAAQKPILYDYEHNSRYGDSRAAGWITALVYEAGRGLFGHVEWVATAARQIAEKEYRYSSPYFIFDEKSGEITQIISVALTNNPALEALNAVDLTLETQTEPEPFNPNGENAMTPEQIAALQEKHAALSAERAALTNERATLNTENASLKADAVALSVERDTLKTQLAALTAEKEAAVAATEKEKHATLLTAALTDGRLTPAQKPWAEKQGLAALTEYLAATKPLPLIQNQFDPNAGTAALTAEEKAMCEKTNTSHEDFIKYRDAK